MRRFAVVLAFMAVCAAGQRGAAAQAVESYPAAPAPQAKEKGPIGALSLGYIYIAAQAPTGDWSWHQHGFYGIPQVNFTPWLAVIGDFVSVYNTGANTHEHIEVFLGGPLFTAYSKKRLSPFAFATGGKTRDAKAGTITWTPTLATGGGVTYKLNKHLALLFVPGEYVRNFSATGRDTNGFTSRFGIVLPVSK